MITDNVIITYETLHSMRAKQKSNDGSMVIKLDISKAYYRIEWKYLKLMMKKLHSAEQWISRIMFCVSIVSYSMLINGQPRETFRPERGLRQGDPLSPYLYLLCVERLSSLINLAKSSKKISIFKVARDSKPITYSFLANDSLLFCKAKLTEWLSIQNLLNLYKSALS